MKVARKRVGDVVDGTSKHVDNLTNELVFAWKLGEFHDFLLVEAFTLSAESTLEFESLVLFGELGEDLSWSYFVIVGDGIKKLTFKCARVGVFINSDFAHGDTDETVFDDLDLNVVFASKVAKFLQFR